MLKDWKNCNSVMFFDVLQICSIIRRIVSYVRIQCIDSIHWSRSTKILHEWYTLRGFAAASAWGLVISRL